MLLHSSEFLHSGEVKVFFISTFEYHSTFGGIEEFTLLIEKFEGVPLFRVMGGREDDSSISL